MEKFILYDENYKIDIYDELSPFHFHIDYGTRYFDINMPFQHFHNNYEMYFMLNGEAKHIIEGKVFDIKENDFVFLKPYILHKSQYLENQPCKRMIITFNIEFIDTFFPLSSKILKDMFEEKQPLFRFDDKTNQQIIEKFNNIYKLSKEKNTSNFLLLSSYLLGILGIFVNYSNSNEYFMEHNSDDSLESKIYEITTYIHSHYAEELTLNFLSSTFFISPHYLSRQFKAITNFSLIEYIQETRIKKAQELLLDTDLKIVEIVNSCGFGSLSQFNRVFNRIAGLAPTTYRRMNKL